MGTNTLCYGSASQSKNTEKELRVTMTIWATAIKEVRNAGETRYGYFSITNGEWFYEHRHYFKGTNLSRHTARLFSKDLPELKSRDNQKITSLLTTIRVPRRIKLVK